MYNWNVLVFGEKNIFIIISLTCYSGQSLVSVTEMGSSYQENGNELSLVKSFLTVKSREYSDLSDLTTLTKC